MSVTVCSDLPLNWTVSATSRFWRYGSLDLNRQAGYESSDTHLFLASMKHSRNILNLSCAVAYHHCVSESVCTVISGPRPTLMTPWTCALCAAAVPASRASAPRKSVAIVMNLAFLWGFIELASESALSGAIDNGCHYRGWLDQNLSAFLSKPQQSRFQCLTCMAGARIVNGWQCGYQYKLHVEEEISRAPDLGGKSRIARHGA